MSLLARATDFQPGGVILSQPFDDEFNQLVNALSGISQNKSIKVISNDDAFAVARFDQRGTNHIIEGYADGAEVFRLEKDGDIVSLGLVGAAGIYTFGSIPLFPNANPTTDNQGARKKYVDDKKISFSIGFSISDPATANLNARDFGSFIVPAGGAYTFTKGKVMFREGTHTAGGSLTFKIDQSGVGDKSTLILDNTNNTAGQVYPDNFGDFTAAEDQIFSCYISARSGAITEKNVMVVLEGFRTPF